MTDSLSLALADCLEALDRGETIAQCLARHPARRDELAELLAAAQQLRAASNAAPSREFQHVARARLLNRLAPRARLNGLAPVTPGDSLRSTWQTLSDSFRRPAMRWIAMLLVVTTMLGAAGAAYASGEALPGDGLYPVKRALEAARLALAFNSAEALDLRLQFANRRAAEAQALAALGRMEEATAAGESYERAMAELHAEARRLATQTGTVQVNVEPVATGTPLPPTATPRPSATPSPSHNRPTLAVTIRATPIVTGLPTGWATYVPNYCWPGNLPTPTQWPEGWPTPSADCTPLPIPTLICWPAQWPTPVHWPPHWPKPSLDCPTPVIGATLTQIATQYPTPDWQATLTQVATMYPTPNWQATLTAVATQYPSPNWQATATALATQYPNVTPPPIPTFVAPTFVGPTFVPPTIVVPTEWATYVPTGWPPRP